MRLPIAGLHRDAALVARLLAQPAHHAGQVFVRRAALPLFLSSPGVVVRDCARRHVHHDARPVHTSYVARDMHASRYALMQASRYALMHARSAHRQGARARGTARSARYARSAPTVVAAWREQRRGGGGEAGGVRPGSLPVSGARFARSAHRQGARARGTARSARYARSAPTVVAAWRGRDVAGEGSSAGARVGLTCRLRQTGAPGGLRLLRESPRCCLPLPLALLLLPTMIRIVLTRSLG
jgi:hypothetical protein